MSNETLSRSVPSEFSPADPETDEMLYGRARAHMEKYSGAASLDRRLWDATVRLAEKGLRSVSEAGGRSLPRYDALLKEANSHPLSFSAFKVWEALADAELEIRALRNDLSTRSETTPLTDEEIMSAAVTAADDLDATRVSEMVPGGWKATTIFEGDSGLIRFGRLLEKKIAANRQGRDE